MDSLVGIDHRAGVESSRRKSASRDRDGTDRDGLISVVRKLDVMRKGRLNGYARKSKEPDRICQEALALMEVPWTDTLRGEAGSLLAIEIVAFAEFVTAVGEKLTVKLWLAPGAICISRNGSERKAGAC